MKNKRNELIKTCGVLRCGAVFSDLRVAFFTVVCALFCVQAALCLSPEFVTDMRGKQVPIPQNLKRIATIDDGFVESVLTHLGEIDTVVAIGSWSMKRDYRYDFVTASGEKYTFAQGWSTMKFLHPWLNELPCVNSPQGNIISYETLARADPQLVILRVGDCTVGAGSIEAAQKTITMIENLGYPLVVLYAPAWYQNRDLSSMAEEMAVIGRLFGKEKQAKDLATYVGATELLIRERTRNIPESAKKSVLLLGLNPSVRAGGGTGLASGTDTPESYIVEQVVNAKNAFRETGSGRVLNIEHIYALNPDVIVLPTSNGFHPPREILEGADFRLLSELRAIKERHVYALPWTPMNCSRRLEYPLDMLVIAKAAYPDLFSDIKIHEFALQFYKDVYAVDDKTARSLRSRQWLDWTVENDF